MVRAVDIVKVRFYEGPNIYNPRTRVLKAIIRPYGSFMGKRMSDFPLLAEKIREIFPEIDDIRLEGKPVLNRILENDDFFYSVLPFLALILQNRVQWNEYVDFAYFVDSEEEGLPAIIVGYIYRRVGEEAVYMARDIIEYVLEGREIPIDRWLKYLRELYFEVAYGPSTRAIIEAAMKRGIPIIRLDEESNLVQLGYGKYRRLIWASTTDGTSLIGSDIAQDKELTRRILDSAGIPVPRGYTVYEEEEALRAFRRINGPVVVKPLRASKGRGISININNEEELIVAFRRAKKYSDAVIIEEYVRGFDHRILVVNYRVVAVAMRLPAFVVGDGVHTIRELIEIENENPLRGEGHELPLTKIKVDEHTIKVLADQGYTLDSIPQKGERVWLKATANLSTGGVAIDVTDKIHPEIENMAIRIAKLLSMDICGIDVIATDISKPIEESGLKVIEVNAAPGLRMHLYPYEGNPRPVGEAIVNMLFPEGRPYRIPIIAVTGTNGKTTTVRLISHILRLAGYSVGYTSTDGIYINGIRIVKGDCTGPWSTGVLLRDTTIDVAVLEVARGGILRGGLAFDSADIGIITNISEDHLGEYGIRNINDIARVKGLIYEVIRPDGWGIVNADDKLVLEQSSRIRGRRVFVSLYGENNKVFIDHVRNGGIGVTISGKMIVIYDGSKIIPVVNYHDVPLTFDGLAEFNIQNALFAVAATYVMNVPVSAIAGGLLSFAPTPSMNPGRANLIKDRRGYILVDYAHNPKALEFVGRFVDRLARKEGLSKKIAVVSFPGNRTNDLIRKNVEVLSKYFDEFVIKEDRNKRGREPGEMAQLIYNYLREFGVSENKIHIELDEAKATIFGITHRDYDSIVFMNCEDVELVLSIVSKLASFTI